jgi:hypothetical protein
MRNRNHHISVWLNNSELLHLNQQSAVSGLKMEPLVRSLIMNLDILPRPPNEYGALLRELSAIGNNVNQIAHIANSNRNITPEQISRAVELTEKAWRLLKERM